MVLFDRYKFLQSGRLQIYVKTCEFLRSRRLKTAGLLISDLMSVYHLRADCHSLKSDSSFAAVPDP